MLRILRAVAEGKMTVNQYGRYVIYADPKRPDRRSRELLAKRGLIQHRYVVGEGSRYVITAKGRNALDAVA